MKISLSVMRKTTRLIRLIARTISIKIFQKILTYNLNLDNLEDQWFLNMVLQNHDYRQHDQKVILLVL